MIQDYTICLTDNSVTLQHNLEAKSESCHREILNVNVSTCGSFSQVAYDQSCDLSTSPLLSNQDEIESDHDNISLHLDQQVIDAITKTSYILKEIVKFQTSFDKNNSRYTKNICFNNSSIPCISLNEYLNKIMREARLELDICVIGLFYIDRLIRCQPQFSINELNCHRLILTSIMIASKMFQDIQPYDQPIKLFSLIGGICESQLFVMEQTLLENLNYKLFIDEEEYQNYKQQLNELHI